VFIDLLFNCLRALDSYLLLTLFLFERLQLLLEELFKLFDQIARLFLQSVVFPKL